MMELELRFNKALFSVLVDDFGNVINLFETPAINGYANDLESAAYFKYCTFDSISTQEFH